MGPHFFLFVIRDAYVSWIVNNSLGSVSNLGRTKNNIKISFYKITDANTRVIKSCFYKLGCIQRKN